MNYVREYWRKIESGEIITSRRVKAVYGRLVREMDEPPDGSPWYFDEETGERPIIFVERFCKQSQGTLGATLELDLFQKAFIQSGRLPKPGDFLRGLFHRRGVQISRRSLAGAGGRRVALRRGLARVRRRAGESLLRESDSGYQYRANRRNGEMPGYFLMRAVRRVPRL